MIKREYGDGWWIVGISHDGAVGGHGGSHGPDGGYGFVGDVTVQEQGEYMIDENDPKQIAGALRLASTYLGSGLHDNAVKSLERQANALDPPYKVDRSLRGWVLVVGPTSRSVWWACRDGLQQWATIDDQIDYSWATVEDYGWRVTKLRTLQPDEVAVTLEPVKDWPEDAAYVWAVYVDADFNECGDLGSVISRDEAERMEVE